MAQGVNSLVYALGSGAGSAVTTSLLSAHLIPHTPLSQASGYTNSYILCGLLGVFAFAIAVAEARVAVRRAADRVPLTQPTGR